MKGARPGKALSDLIHPSLGMILLTMIFLAWNQGAGIAAEIL